MIQKLPVATIWQLFGEDVLTHDIISAAWMQAWIKWDRCVLCIVPYSIYKIWIHWEQRRFLFCFDFLGHVSRLMCHIINITCHSNLSVSHIRIHHMLLSLPYIFIFLCSLLWSLIFFSVRHYFFFLYFKLNACLVLSNLYCIPFGWMRTIRHIHAQP